MIADMLGVSFLRPLSKLELPLPPPITTTRGCAEEIVVRLYGGKRAPSRTQKGWDVTSADGLKIQVKYLANSHPGRWVNEHEVVFPKEARFYAVVIIQDLKLQSVVVFDKKHVKTIREALDCRSQHSKPGFCLTKRRYDKIVDAPEDFASVGVTLHRFGTE